MRKANLDKGATTVALAFTVRKKVATKNCAAKQILEYIFDEIFGKHGS